VAVPLGAECLSCRIGAYRRGRRRARSLRRRRLRLSQDRAAAGKTASNIKNSEISLNSGNVRTRAPTLLR
jgi:hypothetical protein